MMESSRPDPHLPPPNTKYEVQIFKQSTHIVFGGGVLRSGTEGVRGQKIRLNQSPGGSQRDAGPLMQFIP